MIRTEIFEAPEWNRGEIMRYARIRGADGSFDELIDSCISESEPLLSYRVCYTELTIARRENTLLLGNIITESNTVKKAMKNAEHALLFAATIGAPFDRLIARYSALSPSKALMLQAIGAERVESLCDAFCARKGSELRGYGKHLAPRVSPGYGDIPLYMQRDIFSLLDCPRKIGLTLDESLLMSPSKSVTAIAGIVSDKEISYSDKCEACNKTDCIYRK